MLGNIGDLFVKCMGSHKRPLEVPSVGGIGLLVVVVVVVLLLTTKSHTNRSHVSNIFTCVVIYSINIFVFCNIHDFLLQKGTIKLTTARLNYLHLTSSTEIHSIVRNN